jgi:hypothetical protein
VSVHDPDRSAFHLRSGIGPVTSHPKIPSRAAGKFETFQADPLPPGIP